MLKTRKYNKGFTLAETLVVVAIIVVLAALAFVGVTEHMRSMAKLEYDSYAKEIFIAAQNHLSMAESQGYLGRTTEAAFGTVGSVVPDDDGVYYFVVNAKQSEYNSDLNNTASILGLMLPFGSIDETVRSGGSYIIRYHKESGQVLDVFYWSENVDRYSHTYINEYVDFYSKRDNKDALKVYEPDKSVIGYYGGVEAQSLPKGTRLLAPGILVHNAEQLYVKVKDNNDSETPGVGGYTLVLTITGVQSDKSVVVDFGTLSQYSYAREIDHTVDSTDPYDYIVTLDNITSASTRFAALFGDDGLIPGENIEIQALARNNELLTNVAYSTKRTTNSLFDYKADDEKCGVSKALIGNIRHLENLDDHASSVSYSGLSVHITEAEQITNLSWDGFPAKAGNSAYTYQPVSPGYGLSYDGKSHKITGITVASGDNAGVFGTLSDSSIYNLTLVDCSISGVNAGALAGTVMGGINGSKVQNVLAIHSTGSEAKKITGTGSGSAGGLIGTVNGKTTVEYCAAAVLVNGGDAGNAGGLIGTVTGADVDVNCCYAGGHTTGGKYTTSSYNVTGVTAGGLIGAAGSATISNSYSTCSASGTTAGGLVGTASGGSITECYATGLVSGTTKGAFAGTLASMGEVSGKYYRIINELPVDGAADGSKGYDYLKAVNGAAYTGVTPLDNAPENDIATFNGFVGNAAAKPYDNILRLYYQGKYALKTYIPTAKVPINGTDTALAAAEHYGDWPAPETWVKNLS